MGNCRVHDSRLWKMGHFLSSIPIYPQYTIVVSIFFSIIPILEDLGCGCSIVVPQGSGVNPLTTWHSPVDGRAGVTGGA